ncbi:hypothetical protein G4B88_021007 [Cannabis sativa]|uniref:RNase H type-1 domain-containing protein n=1 Tax=Cannabis sativa TaxID=3483 RepID=A0A7J6GAC1_CANSA|nr:hypothetical protein G4B88_021007 [Cannabis sativa]
MDSNFDVPVPNSTNPITSSDLSPQHTDLHQTTTPVIPQLIITTSVITHTDKSKGIAIPEPYAIKRWNLSQDLIKEKIAHTQKDLDLILRKNQPSKKSGAPSPIFVKAQALLEGLIWCQNSQVQPLLVLSDRLQLTNKINSKWQDNSTLSGLVLKIRQSLSTLSTVSFMNIPRIENVEAHKCAKEALRRKEDCSWRP